MPACVNYGTTPSCRTRDLYPEHRPGWCDLDEEASFGDGIFRLCGGMTADMRGNSSWLEGERDSGAARTWPGQTDILPGSAVALRSTEKISGSFYAELEEFAGWGGADGRTEGREMGPDPRCLPTRSRGRRGRRAVRSQERNVESARAREDYDRVRQRQTLESLNAWPWATPPEYAIQSAATCKL